MTTFSRLNRFNPFTNHGRQGNAEAQNVKAAAAVKKAKEAKEVQEKADEFAGAPPEEATTAQLEARRKGIFTYLGTLPQPESPPTGLRASLFRHEEASPIEADLIRLRLLAAKPVGFNEGTVLASGKPEELVYNESVRRVYLGENFRM